MTDAAVAVGTSVLIGLAATRYDQYAFWRSWAARTFALAMAAFVIIYALAGLCGLAIAGAVVSGSNGAGAAALAGGAGHAALRAQVQRLGPGPDEGGRSALAFVRDWIVGLLDGRARAAVERWVKGSDDRALIALTFDVFWRYVDDPGAPDQAPAAKLHELLEGAASDLGQQTGAIQADARGRLRGFCGRELEQRRVPRGDL